MERTYTSTLSQSILFRLYCLHTLTLTFAFQLRNESYVALLDDQSFGYGRRELIQQNVNFNLLVVFRCLFVV
jgi:hypothetical protein